MDENELKNATGRERNPHKLTPLRTEQDEMDERLWQEMERLRQQQRPLPRRREDLPRPVSPEDLLTLPNIRPGNTPISPSPSPNHPAPAAPAIRDQAPRTNPPGYAPGHPGPASFGTPTPSPAGKLVRLPAAVGLEGLTPGPEDTIEPFVEKDACPYCKGSGFLRMDAPVGDPNFGKLVPCECTMALKERKAFEELKKTSNLDHFRDLTFDTFNARVPGTRDGYEAALRFARDPSDWLVLIGNYGCGKTHLAAAIANDALNKRVPLYFAVVPDLLDYLRATFDPNSEASYDQRFEAIRNVPLLVLDDLGTENAKPWAREKLYQIINHRYNAKLPTVITTNNDLDNLDGRIRSRLCDRQLCRTIFIQADDYRALDNTERQRLLQNPVARHKFK